MKNNQNVPPRFGFTPKTDVAVPKTGFVFTMYQFRYWFSKLMVKLRYSIVRIFAWAKAQDRTLQPVHSKKQIPRFGE